MNVANSIQATLAYHDIFDYPLTLEEIHRFLIDKKATSDQIEKELEKLQSSHVILERSDRISTKHNLYALRTRKKLFQIRKQRARYSQTKLKRAYFYATLLMLIPTLKLVAASGALAMENSHKNDDIDLVLITSKGTLWTTRFLANVLLLPFKRKPAIRGGSLSEGQGTSSNVTQLNNKACLNLFLDESDLKIKDQNLYTAHEISQLKVLWDRSSTYQKLIKSNNWIHNFLPNWTPLSVIPAPSSVIPAKAGNHKSSKSIVSGQLSILERLLRSFQLWYMRKKITTERIRKHQLFFHPKNTQDWVLKEYQKRLKKLIF